MSVKKNVLLIVIDQFRGDLLKGSPLAKVARLPNLRRLATEAVSFDRHYSVVAPCGPSRASLLTGQYAMNHRSVRNGTPLRHDTPNLATVLRAAGYVPRLFGYTDTAQDPRVLDADDPRLETYEELMPGFDEVVRMRMETDDSEWRAHLATMGIDLEPYPGSYRPDGETLSSPARYPAEASDTAFLTDRFLTEMGKASRGWCAALTFIRPHPPLVAPAPYNTLHDPKDMPPPATTESEEGDRGWHPFLAAAQDKQPPRKMVEGFDDLQPSPATTAALRATYLGLAAEVDHHIGRVVDWLKATEQWDNTLLVVTADHGEMLGDFGLWGKGTFHDAAFHVPLIIRDPAHREALGHAVSGMTESVDVSVTILDALGLDVPHSMDGQSLLPQVSAPDTPTKGVSFSEYDFGDPVKPTVFMRALDVPSRAAALAVLRTETHHLIQFCCDLPQILFETGGLGERRNISRDPGATPILLDLTRKMLCHRMQHSEGTFSQTMVGDGGVKTGSH